MYCFSFWVNFLTLIQILRKLRQLNLDKSKESSKILSDLLKSDLAQAVDAPEINQRERGARKQQLARFQKDFQEAMQSFQDTATAAATAVKRHAVPSSSSASDSGRSSAATKVGKGKVGGEGLDDPFLQRMQQVEFDSAMVEERDEAINDIAQSIMEVNETMRDLANIVDEQGKDIDQIEVNTTNAEDNTEKGVGFLTDAEKYQKGYRKWILVLVCIIVVAAGGAAGAYVGLKH
jgi:syntaxin 7